MLNKLNPRHYLFMQVFAWFWLTLLATLGLLVFLSSMHFAEFNAEPLNKKKHHYMQHLASKVEQYNKNKKIPLSKIINHPRFLRHDSLYLRALGEQPDIRAKRLANTLDLTLLGQLDCDTPHHIFTEHYQAYGPFLVTLPQGDYWLYKIKPQRKVTLATKFNLLPFELKALVALGASLLLSLLFTRSLIRPIKVLRDNAKRLASGQFDQPITTKRKDEIGQLTDEFNHMRSQLSALLGSQKRLLADVSHELRSPLTRLSMANALAQQQANDATQNYLQRIEKEAKQLESMIADVLTLSRLETHNQPLNLHPTELNALLTPIFNDAKFEANAKQKTLHLPQIAPLTLTIDAALIASAIENLLRNAIKYAAQHIYLHCEQHNQHFTLTIHDDGQGVEPHALNKLTEPFYRDSNARQRSTGGIGLGLAIANKAVLAHKGELVLQNHPQGGLVASITLPLT